MNLFLLCSQPRPLMVNSEREDEKLGELVINSPGRHTCRPPNHYTTDYKKRHCNQTCHLFIKIMYLFIKEHYLFSPAYKTLSYLYKGIFFSTEWYEIYFSSTFGSHTGLRWWKVLYLLTLTRPPSEYSCHYPRSSWIVTIFIDFTVNPLLHSGANRKWHALLLNDRPSRAGARTSYVTGISTIRTAFKIH